MGNQQVRLQLWKVICRDETGGSFVERFGNDEIALSAIGIDAVGEVFKVDPFSVFAGFDDKDVFTFDPAKTLFTLAVPEQGIFPKVCRVIFLLAEVGGGGSGHEKATDALFNKAKDVFDAIKADMAANGQDPTTEPDFSEKTEEGIKDSILNWTKETFLSGLLDDVFPPKGVSVSITSPDFLFSGGSFGDSPEEFTEFTAHDGHYTIVSFWQIEQVVPV